MMAAQIAPHFFGGNIPANFGKDKLCRNLLRLWPRAQIFFLSFQSWPTSFFIKENTKVRLVETVVNP
jgi:hypothetical protein